MASVPRSVEQFEQEILRMQEEIVGNKLMIEDSEQKILEIEISIDEIRSLQEKAQFLIRCNERKNQRYCEEMGMMKKCLHSLSEEAQIVGDDKTISDLKEEIERMRKTKTQLANDLEIQKKRVQQKQSFLEISDGYSGMDDELNVGNIERGI